MQNKTSFFSIQKLILIATIVVIISILSFLMYLYFHIQSAKVTDFNKTEQFIYDETNIEEIEKITHFQEKEAYHIVVGKDEANRDYIIFIPISNNNLDVISIALEDTISEQRIKTTIANECGDCHMIHATYAMINEQPLWEIAYMDEANRYVLDYFTLQNGERYEQLRLKRKYSK